MDVDALTGKDGNGKDGKGGKGRKHGSPDANGNKTVKEKFVGECWVCGKTGHRSSECCTKTRKERTVEKERKEGKQRGKEKKQTAWKRLSNPNNLMTQ
eukprot:2161928-Amphidinium_carterae.1